MPRAIGEKPYSPMIGGLVTEASPLAAPENTTADEQNFLLETDGGIRKRRKGFTNANSDFTKTVSGSTEAKLLETFYWKGTDLFCVVLSFTGGNETWIRFHSNDSTYTYQNEFQIATNSWTFVSISEIRDSLIITGGTDAGASRPFLIERDGASLNIYYVNLYVRDFELLDDDLGISERPATLTSEHRYNLLNAGWYADRPLSSTGNKGDVISNFFSSESVYPSNADIAALGLKVDNDGNEEFDPETLTSTIVGSSEAPRGHYVYKISDFDRNKALTDKNTDGTASTTLEVITVLDVALPDGTVATPSTSTVLTNLQTDVSTNTADINTINTNISGIESDITSIESDVTTLQADVDNVEAEVDDLKMNKEHTR